MSFLTILNDHHLPARHATVGVLTKENIKKLLDDGYYLYWIDTEDGMEDPSVQYLLQHDYLGKIGPAKVEPDKLTEMMEHAAKIGKLYEMHRTVPDTRIHL